MGTVKIERERTQSNWNQYYQTQKRQTPVIPKPWKRRKTLRRPISETTTPSSTSSTSPSLRSSHSLHRSLSSLIFSFFLLLIFAPQFESDRDEPWICGRREDEQSEAGYGDHYHRGCSLRSVLQEEVSGESRFSAHLHRLISFLT